jgi:hypothetical protein
MSETQAKSAAPLSSGPRVRATRRAFLLLIGAIPACAQDAPHDEIRFDLSFGVPIIPAIVNGHKARLMVDTGASRSMFAAKVIGDTHGDDLVRITTLGGDRLLKDGKASITVGSLSVHLPNVLVDGKLLVAGNADGLLGTDFWAAAGGLAFDYMRRTLTMGAAPCG